MHGVCVCTCESGKSVPFSFLYVCFLSLRACVKTDWGREAWFV